MFIKRGDGKIISIIEEEDLSQESKEMVKNLDSKKEINSKNSKEDIKKLEN